jgi:hypothetical protein
VPKEKNKFSEYQQRFQERNLEYFSQKAYLEDKCNLEGMECMDLGFDGTYLVCGGPLGIRIYLISARGPLENAYLQKYRNVKAVKCLEADIIIVVHG